MKADIKLSKRLKMVASFISEGTFFADIGSDHAYLPCYICLKDEKARAIAGEVREGPYHRAEETVAAYQLSDKVEVRLGDGLQIINSDEGVKELVVAGMGGGLISQIIESGKEKLTTIDRLVLQPNNSTHNVRKLLLNLGYSLTHEKILEDNNHIYEILVADKINNEPFLWNNVEVEKQLLFGPYLMKEKSPVFLKKWKIEREKLMKVIHQMKNAKHIDYEKLAYYETQLKWMEEILT